MNVNNNIYTLHKYFIWADRMREHFDKILKTTHSLELESRESFDCNLYMSYWYGGMYVVIEGWKDLKLSDSKIDEFLTSPNVNLLKRYRNGVFHFQKDYFDNRFVNFIQEDSVVKWIRELWNEFSRFFLDWIRK